MTYCFLILNITIWYKGYELITYGSIMVGISNDFIEKQPCSYFQPDFNGLYDSGTWPLFPLYVLGVCPVGLLYW